MNKTIKKLVVIAAVALSAGALAQTYNAYNHKKWLPLNAVVNKT